MTDKKNKKTSSEKESNKIARLNLSLEQDTMEYIKTVGAARFGSMTAYIEELVRRDRESWKENEKALREILSRE